MTTLANGKVATLPVGAPRRAAEHRVTLLTGGSDRPYAFGLAKALLSKDVALDFIGSDELDIPELRAEPGLTFLNLRRSQTEAAGLRHKATRIFRYDGRLSRYAVSAGSRLFYVLWNNKLELFDRTVLMLDYKLLGEKVVLTAHNVNAERREAQYHLADHILVHTAKMRDELVRDFGVDPGVPRALRVRSVCGND